MKVAIVIENYTAGGSDVVAREIARLDKNNEYCFFVNKHDDKRNLQPVPSNASIVLYKSPTIPDLNDLFDRLKFNKLIRRITKPILYPLFLLICLLEITIKIMKWNPEITICNNGGYPGGYITRFLPLILKIFIKRQFMIVHNLPTEPKIRIMSKLIDYLIEKLVIIISVSNEVQKNLSDIRNIKSNVLVNSYFKEMVKIKHEEIHHDEQIVFWCIGSITPIKNQLDLVEKIISFERNLERQIQLNFIGLVDTKDEYTQEILTLSQKAKVTEIIFHGFINNFQFENTGRQFLILNSTREGLPLVLLEGMAAGIPVVSTPAGGVPEVIKEGWNGFMFNGREQFFSVLKKVDEMSLSDWKRLSNNALCTSEDYSPETYLYNYRKLIA